MVSKSAVSAPTQKTSFASAATGPDPVTGASTKRIQRAAAAAAILFENEGLTELQSTHIALDRRGSKNPSAPSAVCSTASGCASIVNRTSTSSASLAGDSAN